MSVIFFETGEHADKDFCGYEVRFDFSSNSHITRKFCAVKHGLSKAFLLAIKKEQQWWKQSHVYEKYHGTLFGGEEATWFVEGISPLIQVRERDGEKIADLYLSSKREGVMQHFHLDKYGFVGAYLHALEALKEQGDYPHDLMKILEEDHAPSKEIFTAAIDGMKLIYDDVDWQQVVRQHFIEY
ncbi:hypothetical protein [Enterovibrio norvegicus]|uniref:hypothetical protein n=1 Tax=Enterovibrio norvegicus TaxID=188144 RepID=UPI00352BE61C